MFPTNDVRSVCQPLMHPGRLLSKCAFYSAVERHRERHLVERGLLKRLRVTAVSVGKSEVHKFGAPRPCAIPRYMSKGTLLHRQLVDPELVVQRHVGGSRCCL
jgi:hypothetical protein